MILHAMLCIRKQSKNVQLLVAGHQSSDRFEVHENNVQNRANAKPGAYIL